MNNSLAFSKGIRINAVIIVFGIIFKFLVIYTLLIFTQLLIVINQFFVMSEWTFCLLQSGLALLLIFASARIGRLEANRLKNSILLILMVWLESLFIIPFLLLTLKHLFSLDYTQDDLAYYIIAITIYLILFLQNLWMKARNGT